MKKININIKKIIISYILLQPILDVLTSLCIEYITPALTIGIIVRTAFMGFIVIYSLIKSNKKARKLSLIYYILTGIYMCTFIYVSYIQNGTNLLLTQIKGLVKIFYLPIVLVALFALDSKEDIKINNKVYIWILLEYTSVILLGKLFGISYQSYRNLSSYGSCGLFYAANEIGAILSILLPILLIELLKVEKTRVILKVTLFTTIFAILELGTKVPFLTLLILSILFIIMCIYKSCTNKDKEKKKVYITKIVYFLLISCIVFFTIPYTPIGKNLDKNYNIKFVKIINLPKSSKSHSTEKTEKTDIGVTEIVSGRNQYFKKNLTRYLNSRTLEKICGNGYLVKENQVKENKLVEIDFCDIFFAHGILGIIIILIPVVILLLKIFILIIKHFMKSINDDNIVLYCVSIALCLGISLLAGHVFTAPAVSLFPILLILNLNKYLEEFDEDK